MAIPKQATAVFKGTIFDVYQWEQKLYDGSYLTYEAIKRRGTIQIIPVVNDKILLAYESQPNKSLSLNFIGGKQEPNEAHLISAKRELLEETGYKSDDWELFRTYSFGTKIDWQTYLYIARNCKKVAEPKLEAGEKIEIKSFNFDEFVSTVCDESFYTNPNITNDFLRMKLSPAKLASFKNRLFKK